ncbi:MULTISPECIES: alpha-hydroxy-acid oxidizing protein [unclassified Treponema]|uniref:alpha-hydroxy-acid oxidizing protein n=1 Tax=unclassified Treponema TaxID=2638727 RepID=UPI0020A36ABF|nr:MULTISPECIES: alpha-hydroxy-acid oxidizing protein [unclassified Treponema]UTC67368.1 alpha-hydroxy-acid oxidizing protein [Treponema sp. OMZ 789]UTC70096.1 alpha-hydroxy-acid oxidizing protein [Treponema sp. OMZ 790]UTC72812.1 alpha-hydroxy-acid oxidizing protein [Treponema sp. OMZ 791]
MSINKKYKCRLCNVCDGKACIGELPGMGGVFENFNFILNCAEWKNYYTSQSHPLPRLRLAPITGAVENIGYEDERQFYFDLIGASVKADLALSIGDGYPDLKLFSGIEVLKNAKKKGAVFLKPYPQMKLFERIEASKEVAEIIGVDTDAYNIVTMRNLVNLEKKNAKDLAALKKYAKLPFAVKGVFTAYDIEVIKELKPDIAIISNHGGRIETDRGSVAAFADKHLKEIKKYTGEVWADGGLRKRADFMAASSLGIEEVLIGRPCITALLRDKENGIKNFIDSILSEDLNREASRSS